ncbi:MAG: MBL fold metallo-hydrolase [Kordiimonadaceae bacterium]|nr:MBL fold metallo-hydrolase [Kordiimonadaceae bacterium]MBO6569960.1 MBL fold metallo-hydrolase [Kordiimonadaceae bacterium]MBO6965943.1 MBL fold metallo-hydrolase [Kordiimonadaceae bacterium]
MKRGIMAEQTDLKVKTMGNATLQLWQGNQPLLTTDPWLVGRAYFDSWALHHPMSDAEIEASLNSEFLWISHGHPDHMHIESLEKFPKGKKLFIPNHYHDEISQTLGEMGFDVTVMKYRQWYKLSDQLEILCLDNINQDAILIARFGDSLLVNLNDSPLCGDASFIRSLVRQHPNDSTYVFKLVGISADMLNFVDSEGNRTIEPAENYKPGCIKDAANQIAGLGLKNFCLSSSQHIFVRQDSRWANEYEFTHADFQKHWDQNHIRVLPPFVTIELSQNTYVEDWPQVVADDSQFINDNGEDDWSDKLSEEEWRKVAAFFQKFETIEDIIDFVDCIVGGEKRRVYERDRQRKTPRGVRFHVPKNSLLETITWGYFDDLLIGNFMKTELVNMGLYPDFTPRIAKYGGNAKVYSKKNLRKMRAHYWRRNPIGVTLFWVSGFWRTRVQRAVSDWADDWGVKTPMKWAYHQMRRIIPGI